MLSPELNQTILEHNSSYFDVVRYLAQSLSEACKKSEKENESIIVERHKLVKAVSKAVQDVREIGTMPRGEIAWALGCAFTAILESLDATDQGYVDGEVEDMLDFTRRSLLVAATAILVTKIDLNNFPELRKM